MTIAIDARVLMNENYSGVSWYAFNLLAALFELDRENEYVLFYNSKKPVKLPKFDYPNVSYKGFRFSNKLFNFCLNFFSWPKLDELVGGCDIFFAPNLHFVSWSDKCRKVIVVHDLSFLAYPNFFNLKQRLWHKLILNKKILTQADMVIADSNSTKKDLEDLMNVAPEKIEVAHLGADIKANGITREEINSKYNLPDKYFLFVGTIEPR
ncbi:MAG: glycosyltransferase, partial [Candidatus Buchananbacteria bacterium]